ncbi:MAG: ankyrin repeat domain-containing protein [Bellilinea sp.]
MTINEIPEILLHNLIEIGKSNDLSQLSSLLTVQEQHDFSYIMRLGQQSWLSVAETLSKEEIVALIKCFTIAERVYDVWKAGSVSPVIWLFKKLSSLDLVTSNDIANWVLAHTENEYLPFGTLNLGAKSLVEYTQFKKLDSERKNARHETEMQRQELTRKHKAQKLTSALFGAVNRGDIQAVKALIQKGADISATDSKGISVIEYAYRNGNEKILELLRSLGSIE